MTENRLIKHVTQKAGERTKSNLKGSRGKELLKIKAEFNERERG